MAETISGFAISWNRPAIIAGLFEERFARGAFDRHLAQNPDVAALWSHDQSRPLGRISNGALKLRSDNVGLYFALTPDPNAPLGQEALATVGNGTVNEVSVSFTPVVEEWTDDGDMPKRLITEARLFEISLVLGALTARTPRLRSAEHQATASQPSGALKRRCERAAFFSTGVGRGVATPSAVCPRRPAPSHFTRICN
ncbi:HK97 family phage prohead protease [Bradyrhizobium sp. 137]|uniref:HK97 family phage prohead protease n=1 Tax=Bradyrhizobium sp. 137 TaxID=2782614 RepID=UPI001FFAA80D|nr:HK97 family phage prohead protease [Bradyrhizobium sp. 137]